MTKSTAVCLSEKDSSRRSAAGPLLSTSLSCDHVLHISLSKWKKSFWPEMEAVLARGLENRADVVMHSVSKKGELPSRRMLLGLRRSREDDNGPSLIIGPHGGPESADAEDFRTFWGAKLCQLRRFEDGSIRESIDIHNPWGPAYLAPAIASHLLRHHFKEVVGDVTLNHLELLPHEYQMRENVRRVRTALAELSSQLTKLSDSDLPLRRVRGLGSALHCEGDLYLTPPKVAKKSNAASKVVYETGGCLFLKKEANVATGLVRSIPVMLDVTHKKNLDQKMFSCLSTAYLINLKKQLDAKNIPCVLKDLRLLVRFNSLVFSLGVDPPPPQTSEDSTESEKLHGGEHSVETFLQSMGLRHCSWAGACFLIKQWLSAKMLASSVSETTLYLLLANVFVNPLQGLSPPMSVEATMLRFFDFLSFHDFDAEPVVLDENKDMDAGVLGSIARTMAQSREMLPAIVILTPFDAATPSVFSRELCRADVKRLSNLARQTLHTLLSGGDVVLWSLFESTFTCDLQVYDVVIYLKPLQVPKVKERSAATEEGKGVAAFPVVDFDPITSYLNELRECFGELARFYYGQSVAAIGVMLERVCLDQTPAASFKHSKGRFVVKSQLVPNVEATVADFRVLGQGIVRDVQCNIKV